MRADDVAAWRLIAHHKDPEHVVRWLAQVGRLALGWGQVGDISMGQYRSAEDIASAIRAAYPSSRNSGGGGVCLWAFCNGLQIGDLVIVSALGRRRIVMEVEGEYQFRQAPEPAPIGDYQHQRVARQLSLDADELWERAGGRPARGHNMRWTLIQCAEPISSVTKQELIGADRA